MKKLHFNLSVASGGEKLHQNVQRKSAKIKELQIRKFLFLMLAKIQRS